jgi:hypothetical protein
MHIDKGITRMMERMCRHNQRGSRIIGFEIHFGAGRAIRLCITFEQEKGAATNKK